MIELMKKTQAATLAARERLGDKGISSDVSKGKARIIRVEYDSKGKATITQLSDWMTPDLIPVALDALTK